jgi:hypothetical protein
VGQRAAGSLHESPPPEAASRTPALQGPQAPRRPARRPGHGHPAHTVLLGLWLAALTLCGGAAPVPQSIEQLAHFTTARAHGRAVGSGPLRRYEVQVEKGVDISAEEAATEIQRILADPRSWAAHGRGTFQLVSSDSDFVIRIATPATADRLCLAQGLNTRGELNCETADGVVVNLRRWLFGSPTFGGPAADYRHLIINHEVGHEIGIRHHMGCPGPGGLAPVMMQQIKGLDGCRSNAWPYDADGTYITGPTV